VTQVSPRASRAGNFYIRGRVQKFLLDRALHRPECRYLTNEEFNKLSILQLDYPSMKLNLSGHRGLYDLTTTEQVNGASLCVLPGSSQKSRINGRVLCFTP
jgi:hypothetical protein